MYQLNRSLVECATRILLGEDLTPPQKQIVDAWGASNKRGTGFSDHIFKGTDRIYIPLMKSNDSSVVPHQKVIQHLNKNGYDIHDYTKGVAIDKHGRHVRIGKALNKTNADPDTMKAFNNDQSRNNSTHDGLKVCITRHPYDVAGMSTDRGWNSCLNMQGGSNAKYSEQAVTSGAHMAYLIKSDDTDIKSPIARITLNPHHSIDRTQTVLHPEKTTYGTGNNDFEHTVHHWCNSSFVMHHPVYQKDSSVYNDDKAVFLVSKNPKHEADLMAGDETHRGLLASSTHNDDHLHTLAKDNSRWVRSNVAARYHKEINETLKNDPDRYVRRVVALTGDEDHLNHLVNDHDPVVRSAVAAISKNPEHLDRLMMDSHPSVRTTVAMYGNDSHRDHLINDESISTRKFVALYGSPEHVKKLLNDESPMVRAFAQKRMSFKNTPHIADIDWINVPRNTEE